ncbi:hypothetical protein ACUN0C_20165, partial [Faunimonas sp. B44]|uniref:hypothetical protein n=1 Tax=Faunimonas sp. B44 TaxID=3461493 RepID=UPI004043B96F
RVVAAGMEEWLTTPGLETVEISMITELRKAAEESIDKFHVVATAFLTHLGPFVATAVAKARVHGRCRSWPNVD